MMSAIVLLGGATAFVGLIGEATLISKILAVSIVLIGIVQVVFQVDRCAAQHRQWLREWNDILSEIRQTPSPKAVQLSEWIRRQAAIESECVAEMRALANDCYNRTMHAESLEGEPFKVTRWQRLWMQWYPFENAAYR